MGLPLPACCLQNLLLLQLQRPASAAVAVVTAPDCARIPRLLSIIRCSFLPAWTFINVSNLGVRGRQGT